MAEQKAEQPPLFEITELARSAEVPIRAPEIPARSSEPEIAGSSAGQSRPIESRPLRAVSPIPDLPLHETCAHCGDEVRRPGFVILDFEELGVFCGEDCGDKRFRLYLNDRNEEVELDDTD